MAAEDLLPDLSISDDVENFFIEESCSSTHSSQLDDVSLSSSHDICFSNLPSQSLTAAEIVEESFFTKAPIFPCKDQDVDAEVGFFNYKDFPESGDTCEPYTGDEFTQFPPPVDSYSKILTREDADTTEACNSPVPDRPTTYPTSPKSILAEDSAKAWCASPGKRMMELSPNEFRSTIIKRARTPNNLSRRKNSLVRAWTITDAFVPLSSEQSIAESDSDPDPLLARNVILDAATRFKEQLESPPVPSQRPVVKIEAQHDADGAVKLDLKYESKPPVQVKPLIHGHASGRSCASPSPQGGIKDTQLFTAPRLSPVASLNPPGGLSVFNAFLASPRGATPTPSVPTRPVLVERAKTCTTPVPLFSETRRTFVPAIPPSMPASGDKLFSESSRSLTPVTELGLGLLSCDLSSEDKVRKTLLRSKSFPARKTVKPSPRSLERDQVNTAFNNTL